MIIFTNNYNVILVADVSPTDLTILVSSSVGIPTLRPEDYMKLTLEDVAVTHREIVHVTSVLGNTLTIQRGKEGTSPQSFLTNDNAQARLTADILRLIDQEPEASFLRLDGAVPMSGDLTISKSFPRLELSDPSGGTIDIELRQAGVLRGLLLNAGGTTFLDNKGTIGSLETRIALTPTTIDFTATEVLFDSDLRVTAPQASIELRCDPAGSASLAMYQDDKLRGHISVNSAGDLLLRNYSAVPTLNTSITFTDTSFDFTGGIVNIDGELYVAAVSPTIRLYSDGGQDAQLIFYQDNKVRGQVRTDTAGNLDLISYDAAQAVKTRIILSDATIDFTGGQVSFDNDVTITAPNAGIDLRCDVNGSASLAMYKANILRGHVSVNSAGDLLLRNYRSVGSLSTAITFTDTSFDFVGGDVTLAAPYKFIASQTPTSSSDITNKNYVDGAIDVAVTGAISGVILGGRINANGTIQTGSGFTVVKTSTGVYRITSDNVIGSNSFVVTAIIAIYSDRKISYGLFGPSYMDIHTDTDAAVPIDTGFAFAFLAI